jgi:nicotinate-nucleotide--dimethylbenzimidazole phosphoribosyltransferase
MISEDARAQAIARWDSLAKPPGSLGRLEELVAQLAAVQGGPPRLQHPRVIVFAADHGVTAQGVSPYPSAVTQAMVRCFARGRAAVAVLARQAGASLEVIDAGVQGLAEDIAPIEGVCLIRAPVRPGSADLSLGPAMSELELEQALDLGRQAAARAAAEGVDCIALGEMGIGNSTAAAALAAALLGRRAEELVGPGTGMRGEGLQRKIDLVQRALDRVGPATPRRVLAELGGLEIAAMAGLLHGAAPLRVPVLVDGFIASAAALAAVALWPELRPGLILATRSAEPGHQHILAALDARPYLDLGLRLGEASGAALLLGPLRAAVALHEQMATLEEVLGGRL